MITVLLVLDDLPVSLPQRTFKFPLLPLTELHSVDLNGYLVKSSLSFLTFDSGQHAGPENPELHLMVEHK